MPRIQYLARQCARYGCDSGRKEGVMKAIHLNDYGSTENFALVEARKPVPGPDDVLIAVKYAGLRWGDIMQRNGWPSRHRKPPFIPGQEAAGVIEAVGANVKRLEPGMRAIAMPMDGA